MYREILLAIAGISVYPVVSLVLFTVTFGAVLLRVVRMDHDLAARVAALPLDADADGAATGV